MTVVTTTVLKRSVKPIPAYIRADCNTHFETLHDGHDILQSKASSAAKNAEGPDEFAIIDMTFSENDWLDDVQINLVESS